MEDKLVDCRRCKGNACYEQHLPDNITTWFCMGCGFSTSTMFKTESELVQKTLETSPELYKDLMYEDSEGFIWFPATITIPQQGMVFVDGTSVDNWKWAAVKAIPISENEKDKYPNEQTHRMDMTNVVHFSQSDFMDALDIINFYNF